MPELNYESLVTDLRVFFEREETLEKQWRVTQLKAVIQMMTERKKELGEALHKDLGSGEWMQRAIEFTGVVDAAKDALKHLDGWMKPEAVNSAVVSLPCSSVIKPDPLGVTLIIAPWNYPISLVLNPLVGAIAAGNCAVIKPSEVSVHTSALLAKLIPQYLDNRAFRVVEGAVPETTALLREKWDLIFYTGNGFVGRIVMRAAAENLTPVVLELGGKSPTIIAPDADLDKAAKRIAWAKWQLNVGQTCVAPDYVLITEENRQKFVYKVRDYLKQFYGENPEESPDYSRVINERHTQRIADLIKDDPTIDIVTGGDVDVDKRYISPTIVHATVESKVMQDEIFGPVLPIITIGSLEEAVRFVKKRDKPLALYVFTKSSKTADRVLKTTSSGAAVVNDCCIHLANHNLPFGGVGASGMGSYHGKKGFNAFSHQKAVLKKYGSDASIRFPPYSEFSIKSIENMYSLQRVVEALSFTTEGVFKAVVVFALGAFAAFAYNKAGGPLPF